MDSVYPKLMINFKIVDLQEIKTKCDNLKIPIVHHSGIWGMSKLFLDEMFPFTNQSIFIDSDMILGTDPFYLYKEFEKFKKETIFSLTRQKNWTKKGPNFICSCIFLWDMEKSRKINFLKEKMFPAAQKVFGFNEKENYFSLKKRTGGDQDYIYAMNYIYPDYFNEIDHSWNLCYCFRFSGVQSRSKTKDSSGLFFGAIHFNCLKNKYTDFKGWEWVIEYLKWYRWDWLGLTNSKNNLGQKIVINFI
ncbi:glycosyltransferase family 8 [Brachionus plicatilis]|uniref:Glycosyltransferase family 8 n=1 Tax=Brachionus plicatilis TaxID=10195 RepID=A0A3M7SBS9_BRAPC|nr:glycosyltransferase family 8 [Brachionus plicatilis]